MSSEDYLEAIETSKGKFEVRYFSMGGDLSYSRKLAEGLDMVEANQFMAEFGDGHKTHWFFGVDEDGN